jgi:hypothetical protein
MNKVMEMSDYGLTHKFQLPEEFTEAKRELEAKSLYNRNHLPADMLVGIYPGLIDGDDMNKSLARWHADLPGDARWLVAGIHHPPHQVALANFANQSLWAGFQPAASNTPDQAQWFIRELKRLAVDQVALYLPRFHAPRAFGTTVKAALTAGWTGKIMVVTWDPPFCTELPLAGFSNTPLYDQLFPGEWKRWVEYTEKGDVAHPSTWNQFLV